MIFLFLDSGQTCGATISTPAASVADGLRGSSACHGVREQSHYTQNHIKLGHLCMNHAQAGHSCKSRNTP